MLPVQMTLNDAKVLFELRIAVVAMIQSDEHRFS